MAKVDLTLRSLSSAACSMATVRRRLACGQGSPEHYPVRLAAPLGVSLLTSFPLVLASTPGRPSRPWAVGRVSGPDAAVSTGESFCSTS